MCQKHEVTAMAALGFMATGGDDALSAADTEEDTRSTWDSDDTDSDDMPELVSPSSSESDDDVPASNGDESILFVNGPQPRATPVSLRPLPSSCSPPPRSGAAPLPRLAQSDLGQPRRPRRRELTDVWSLRATRRSGHSRTTRTTRSRWTRRCIGC